MEHNPTNNIVQLPVAFRRRSPDEEVRALLAGALRAEGATVGDGWEFLLSHSSETVDGLLAVDGLVAWVFEEVNEQRRYDKLVQLVALMKGEQADLLLERVMTSQQLTLPQQLWLWGVYTDVVQADTCIDDELVMVALVDQLVYRWSLGGQVLQGLLGRMACNGYLQGGLADYWELVGQTAKLLGQVQSDADMQPEQVNQHCRQVAAVRVEIIRQIQDLEPWVKHEKLVQNILNTCYSDLENVRDKLVGQCESMTVVVDVLFEPQQAEYWLGNLLARLGELYEYKIVAGTQVGDGELVAAVQTEIIEVLGDIWQRLGQLEVEQASIHQADLLEWLARYGDWGLKNRVVSQPDSDPGLAKAMIGRLFGLQGSDAQSVYGHSRGQAIPPGDYGRYMVAGYESSRNTQACLQLLRYLDPQREMVGEYIVQLVECFFTIEDFHKKADAVYFLMSWLDKEQSVVVEQVMLNQHIPLDWRVRMVGCWYLGDGDSEAWMQDSKQVLSKPWYVKFVAKMHSYEKPWGQGMQLAREVADSYGFTDLARQKVVESLVDERITSVVKDDSYSWAQRVCDWYETWDLVPYVTGRAEQGDMDRVVRELWQGLARQSDEAVADVVALMQRLGRAAGVDDGQMYIWACVVARDLAEQEETGRSREMQAALKEVFGVE